MPCFPVWDTPCPITKCIFIYSIIQKILYHRVQDVMYIPSFDRRRRQSGLFQFVDPGLQIRLRDTCAEALSFQPCAASCKNLHVRSASADTASSGGAERDHRDPIKAVLLNKGIQDTGLFSPPDRETQINGRVPVQRKLIDSGFLHGHSLFFRDRRIRIDAEHERINTLT